MDASVERLIKTTPILSSLRDAGARCQPQPQSRARAHVCVCVLKHLMRIILRSIPRTGASARARTRATVTSTAVGAHTFSQSHTRAHTHTHLNHLNKIFRLFAANVCARSVYDVYTRTAKRARAHSHTYERSVCGGSVWLVAGFAVGLACARACASP